MGICVMVLSMDVFSGLNSFTGLGLDFVLLTLAMAFVTMGFVEAYKFFRRPVFHKDRTTRWVTYLGSEFYDAKKTSPDGAAEMEKLRGLLKVKANEEPTISKLERLFASYTESEDGKINVAYRLPRKLFLRVIENASNLILERPGKYRPEFFCLARGASKEDRLSYIQDYQQVARIAAGVNLPADIDIRQDEAAAQARGEQLEKQAIVSAVQGAVERNLDAFQLALSQRWLDEVRIASIVCGSAIGVVGTVISRQAGGSIQEAVLLLFLGLLSGFTAMLMHDLFSSLIGKGPDQV